MKRLTALQVAITYTVTVTGIDEVKTDNHPSLRAWVQNGTLYVGGLAADQRWSVYSVTGALVYSAVANNIPLPSRGVYVVTAGTKVVKVVY